MHMHNSRIGSILSSFHRFSQQNISPGAPYGTANVPSYSKSAVVATVRAELERLLPFPDASSATIGNSAHHSLIFLGAFPASLLSRVAGLLDPIPSTEHTLQSTHSGRR